MTYLLTDILNFRGLVVVSTLVLLGGCGGGGGESTTGGGGGGSASSSIVLNLANSGVASTQVFPETLQEETSIRLAVNRVFESLLPSAWADHVSVFLNGVGYGKTGAGESLIIALSAGTYQVTFQPDDGSMSDCSSPFSIGPDQILYWDNIRLIDNGGICEVTYNQDIETVEEGLIKGDGEDPEDDGAKSLICHKNGKTLSVGLPAVQAHLAHGDTTGPCPEVSETTDVANVDEAGVSEEEDAEADSGKKPGKPDKTGKPDNSGNSSKKP
ncbi:MAG: hypothetical protein KTR18_03955 [Acidiferrobacterales bacterium]|nr:hypothetical protein [Acidiferrobacterales bacterium]